MPALPRSFSARAGLAITAVVLAAWLGSLPNGLTYDDGMVLVDPAAFLQHGHLTDLFSKDYFQLSREGTWRPLVTATYMLDARFFGGQRGAHLLNVLWHLLAALLVASVARRLLGSGVGALVAGLLFACHPLAAEAIENVSFREDLLAGALTVLALRLCLVASGWGTAAGLTAFALALLSKESAVVFPGLLALAWAVAPGRPRRAVQVGQVLGAVAVALGWAALRFGPLAGPPNYAAFAGGTRAATLWTMPRVLAHDLRLLVAPWPLLADYSGAFEFGPPTGDRLLALALVPLVPLALVWAWRRDRVLALGAGWFFFALLPVSNLVALPIFAAERFLYLPLMGACLAAGALAGPVAVRWPKEGAIALGVVLATFVALANLRHQAWRNNEALWADVVEHNPRSYRAHANLAIILQNREPERSVALFEQSLALCPALKAGEDVDNVLCSSNAYHLGLVQERLDHRGKALQAYFRALMLRPSNGEAQQALARLSMEGKRPSGRPAADE